MRRQRSRPRVEPSEPLVASNLSKTYDGGVVALRDVSFTVHQGEVFGLLGPNGAGKTTTLGILTTLVRPSGGRARVGGFDVATEPFDVRRVIGVLFQDSVLDVAFSGEENLWLHARLWRVPDARRRIEALDRVGLTVLVSTHYLEEAQGVCDRVAIVDQGEVIATDEPAALVGRLGTHVLDLGVTGDRTRLLAALAGRQPGLGTPYPSASTISIPSHLSPTDLTAVAHRLRLTELGAVTITVRPTTLNDVFLSLTATADVVPVAVPA